MKRFILKAHFTNAQNEPYSIDEHSLKFATAYEANAYWRACIDKYIKDYNESLNNDTDNYKYKIRLVSTSIVEL